MGMFGIILTNRTRILPVVVFGCETWSRVKGRNRPQTKISGRKWEEVSKYRKINCVIRRFTMFSSPNIIRVIVISGFRREVEEICALLGCYAASSGDLLPSFGTTYRLRNYHYTLVNSPEEAHLIIRVIK